ncbi:CDGSH iron-sulfur domain-containing protein [Kangiella sp. HZ709]|uniref:CDGSH iron-sulfur domain-containing protein n=1 Tax=Kangiella sp. HZ709 TaxID=2666328 RepID=UPI0012AFC86B|nr:CDGSH iron-sulfur domain-containing protein [Kangiella sp. HZ709]MRX26883.1 iron-binding protein [Kangiella sp. HZ709]
MSKEKHETAEGILYFDSKKCIHSRNCVLKRPDVFVPNIEGEWIHPENANRSELITLSENCPSGAIEFHPYDSKPSYPLVNTLHIRENGSYAIKANINIDGESEQRLTLCRCGASKSKPLCDGSHSKVGFLATGEPKKKGSEPLNNRNGEVHVEPQKNGPLKLDGNLEICSGTGRTVNRVDQIFLCRCGASKNKPYCDGSHVAINFLSDE